MLDTVVIESANPLTLHITDVDPSEMLVVKSISGLTSAKVGLFTGDYASEGSYYQGRRPEKLTPVITLKMNPDYPNDIEVSDIREILYRTFYQPQPGLDGVLVRLQDDRRPDRYFVGYTEDINTDQFVKEQTVQIAMVCMDSYLFSYDITTGSDPVGWSSTPVAYDGSARTGLKAEFIVKANTDTLTFDINGETMVLDYNFVVADEVIIDTRKGLRSIQVNGVDIMTALSPSSKWLQIEAENNTFKAYGAVEADGDVGLTYYEFRSAWWGI